MHSRCGHSNGVFPLREKTWRNLAHHAEIIAFFFLDLSHKSLIRLAIYFHRWVRLDKGFKTRLHVEMFLQFFSSPPVAKLWHHSCHLNDELVVTMIVYSQTIFLYVFKHCIVMHIKRVSIPV